jgi:hypothetical protein
MPSLWRNQQVCISGRDHLLRELRRGDQPGLTHDPESLSSRIFDAGQFIVSIIFAGGFLLLIYELSQLMEKMDVSKVDPSQLLLALAVGTVGLANAVAGFYLGSKSRH